MIYSRTFLLILITVFAFLDSSNAQSITLAQWNFNATTGAALDPTTIGANTSVSSILFGLGIQGSNNVTGVNGCGQSYSNDHYEQAFNAANNDYWEFTITPLAGYTTKVTSIDFDARIEVNGSTNGPLDWAIRYNVDNYAANLVSASGITSNCGNHLGSVSMNETASPVTFRIYFWNANNQNRALVLDNIRVLGTTVLPITLQSFDVQNRNNTNYLTFATASEKDNNYFAVERSAEGTRWEEIGLVNGAGNSTTDKYYDFTDANPLRGINYYRLRQVDYDGTHTYSKVISITYGATGYIRFSPSPAQERMTINLTEKITEEGIWEVYDAAGRMLLQGNITAESKSFDINTSSLVKGTYIFRLIAGQQTEVKQFIRN